MKSRTRRSCETDSPEFSFWGRPWKQALRRAIVSPSPYNPILGSDASHSAARSRAHSTALLSCELEFRFRRVGDLPFLDCRPIDLLNQHAAVALGHNSPTKMFGRSESLYVRIGPFSQILRPGECRKAKR